MSTGVRRIELPQEEASHATFFTARAGLPATTDRVGTLKSTTEPAPITEPSPMLMPPKMIERAPVQTSLPITMPDDLTFSSYLGDANGENAITTSCATKT